MENLQLKSFCRKIRNFNENSDGLLSPYENICVSEILNNSHNEFLQQHNLKFQDTITISSRAIFEKRGEQINMSLNNTE